MSNPYQSPQEVTVAPIIPTVPNLDAQRAKLRRVARYQRWVLLSLLLNIGVTIGMYVAAQGSTVVGLTVLALALIIQMFQVTCVVMLTGELWNAWIAILCAILCAILMFVPCISLLTLLVINQKATGLLQEHGIRVGFMGADVNKI
jgi:hypothetical protein